MVDSIVMGQRNCQYQSVFDNLKLFSCPVSFYLINGDEQNIIFVRPVGSGAAWRQSSHQKSAGRESEKRKRGRKEREKRRKKRGKKGRGEQEKLKETDVLRLWV